MNRALYKQESEKSTDFPNHVAIIMDGNGRWAKKQNKPRTFGHRKAEAAIKASIEYAIEKKITCLTFFAFSTENWQRPKEEVSFLMKLFKEFLEKSEKLLDENQVKLTWIGLKNNIPNDLKALFDRLIEKTKNYSKLTLCLAVDYGAKAEILQAVQSIVEKISSGALSLDDLNEVSFEQELFTKDLPPLDLIIRTSGEYRLSNFLLWQAAYSELYFCDALWPDFNRQNLDAAFLAYQKRTRRWGKIE